MTDVLVCDASALVALLLDSGDAGSWVADTLSSRVLAAPHLMPYECANIIRRQEMSAAISADQAALAHRDLSNFPIELWPYEWTSAVEYLHKAREEAGYADFQAAIRFGKQSEDMALKARQISAKTTEQNEDVEAAPHEHQSDSDQ